MDEMETEESPISSPAVTTKKEGWSQKILKLVKLVDCFDSKGFIYYGLA